MGLTDWAITAGGDTINHRAFQNALVTPELPRPGPPNSDDWCREFWNDGGVLHGHSLFLYNRSGHGITKDNDMSVRGCFCMAPRTDPGHVTGLGTRMSTVPSVTTKIDRISEDGYQFVLIPTAAAYDIKLLRVISGAETTLWSDTRAGGVGTYKWFQFRLDMIVQPNDDLLLHVFENDLTTNDCDAPVWGTALIEKVEMAPDASDAAAGAGFGVMCESTAGYGAHVDWTEVWKGS